VDKIFQVILVSYLIRVNFSVIQLVMQIVQQKVFIEMQFPTEMR